MASVNMLILLGNMTRDPELRVTPKGTAVCQFGIAVNRKFKDSDNNEREEVTFVDVEMWGPRGEAIAKYLTKGSPVYLQGRLRLDQWEDKATKEKRSKLKMVAEEFQFIPDGKNRSGEGGRGDDSGGGGRDEQRGGGFRSNDRSPQQQNRRPAAPQENLDEDVPF